MAVFDIVSGERLLVVAANRAAAALLGHDAAGRYLDQLPAAQGTYGLAAHLSLCLKAGTTATYEHGLRDDRGERHFHITLTPLWDCDGRLFRVIAVAREIPEERQALRFGALELALDRMRQAVYLLDDSGRIRYASAEASRALGYTRPELAAMHVTELDPQWSAARWEAATAQIKEHGSFRITSRHRRKDGTTFPVEIEASYVLSEGEEFRVAVVQDITTWQSADAELRSRAESFRALAENSPDVLVRYDRNCRRIYANPALLRLAGAASSADLLGKKPTENSPVVTQAPPYEATIREVLATGAPREMLFHVKTARGAFWHQALFVPERDARGEIAGVLGLGHDVTPLLDAQQTLRRRNRDLRTLGRCRQSLIRATDEPALLEEVCRIICEDTGHRMAWVGYAEQDPDKTLRPVAWAGPDSAYIAGLHLSWSADYTGPHCSAGMAIRTAQPVMVQEFETDPRMTETRTDARRHGFRSGVALPLADQERVFGVLVICAAEPDALSPDELHLLEELAQDVAFGLVALRDRVRRQHAEQALRDNEQKYRAIFRNSPLGLFRLGFDGRFQEVNPAFAAMFGYPSPADVISEVIDIAAQIYASPESHTTSVASLLAAPDTTRHQTQFRRKDGSEFTGRLFLKTIRNANGIPVFLEGIVEDITATLKSEQHVRLLTFALNHVRDEAYLITEEGAFEYVNDGAARALGYSREELLAMRVTDIDPLFTIDQWRAHWHTLKATGALTFEGEHRSRDRAYPVEIAANYFEYDGRGYNLALCRDISERRQAEQSLRRLNRALATLSSGNEALVRAQSEGELLDKMCRVVAEVGNYRFVWIGFTQPDGTIVPRAWAGEEQGFLAVRQQFCAQDPVCAAVSSGSARVIHRFDQPDLPEPFRAELARCGFRSCAALPLSPGEDTGVLAIYASEQDAFDADEVRLLTEMSHDLAYGISTLRLRGEREKSEARLRASMQSTIEALSSTVELRDPYTAGHQQRVARLAMRVARELQWSEERIQAIYLAGMVHDIGKMAVPAEILSKPGPLTEAEMTLVRSHADAGFEILKSIDFPWPIGRMVHQHHERLDGSGYPRGLRGDEICMEARVLAVCDVVEAMTSHRPYRAGFGMDKALATLQEGRGTLFDDSVVDVCTGLLKNRQPALE